MRLGLIGLPMSGKTTIFNALTRTEITPSAGIPGKLDVQIAVVEVPDPRLDALYELYQPERKVRAKITYADVGGLAKGVGSGGLSGPFRNELNQMDGFIHVVRAFESAAVPHPEGSIDPQRDLDILNGEFLLADLIVVENRITRLKDEISKGKDRDANQRELAVFERLLVTLENEQPLRTLSLTDAEKIGLRGYGFLTLRPQLILVNLGDDPADPAELVSPADDTPVIAIHGALEAEIAQLEADEAAMFMEEYGITEPVRDRVVAESYNLLNVQTFFTEGSDEVRAWPHPIGATAQQAAGVVHSDMERGFIRAEIVPVDVLLELGSMAEARKAGKLRLEGKTYIMQDGDVMIVRFNV